MLDDLGVLAVHGAEARKFLNGQLSQDVLGLDRTLVRLAGLHNPQGRNLAVMRLLAWDADTVLCVLPRALIAETRALLVRFLLRSKAELQDASEAWCIEGLWAETPLSDPPLSTVVGATAHHGGAVTWRHTPDGRCLRLTPRPALAPTGSPAPPADPTPADPAPAKPAPAKPAPADPAAAAARTAWRLADVAAGLPEVLPTTRASFVAQMLNLDLLDGVSFTKGCYTGQEVIARAHYRGRVKRRLQRFEARPADPSAALPTPGETLRFVDGRSAQWVEGAKRPDGAWEFLAVAPLPEQAAADEATNEEPSPTDAATERLVATALPLPYALP
jgi:folate-binding protein YgfZ